nr:response regulator [Motiliproteus sediminis]
MISVNELAILIVEPSVFQQKVISQELADSGCQTIDCVASKAEALDFMRRYSPDLVVSAMYLPDGDGVELVTAMRTDPKLERIPFMLISSETRLASLEPIRQAGSVAILPKPFRHDDLERALKATLEFIDPEELELDDYDTQEIKVLLVDDSEFALKHIGVALEAIGIQKIVTARNGTDALTAMQADTFDLVFTDFNMPGMDGGQLTQQIRTHSNQPYVPILLVTSEQNESRLEGVMQAGVNAICSKPFSPSQLKGLIHSILSA